MKKPREYPTINEIRNEIDSIDKQVIEISGKQEKVFAPALSFLVLHQITVILLNSTQFKN
jgi:hypothetical protein